MTKKIFSLVLAISVVLCTFSAISPVNAATNTNVSVWDGKLTGLLADGTGVTAWFDSQKDNSVIEIYEAKQLAFIARMSNRTNYSGWGNADIIFTGKTIKLMTDIDLDNKQWLPICFDSSRAFLGTFDGNGHKIKNLYGANLTAVENITPAAFGLIGTLAGTVKNLVIENVTYDLDLSVVTNPVAGAICGNAGYYTGNGNNIVANIENCAVKNVKFNVTNSTTFSDKKLYGLASVCGCGYRVDFKNTYVNGVNFKLASEVSDLLYGGFNNFNKAYRTNIYENCYLANAAQSIGGAAATDLKWGYFYTGLNHSMTLCYTTSNTTEPSASILNNSAANRIVYGLVTNNADSGFSNDTNNKNSGYPLLTMEAVPVYKLTITKNGDKFTASAVFNDVPETTKLFIAAYDKTTDMLVFADAIDSSIAAKEISDYDPAKHEIRAFVWDIADYTPLVNSVTYTE